MGGGNENVEGGEEMNMCLCEYGGGGGGDECGEWEELAMCNACLYE